MLLQSTSYYSLLSGVHSPDSLCKRAKELGYSSVAITDTDNLYALPDFLACCKKYALLPVIAACITDIKTKISAIIYVCEDGGFESLCKIISDRHGNDQFDLSSSIQKNHHGIAVATADVSLIKSLRTISIAPYYLITSLKRKPDYITKNNIPGLIVPPAAFINPTDHELHCLLRAIDENTVLSRIDQALKLPEHAFLRAWLEIKKTFAIFEDAIATTESFIDTISYKPDFGAPIMPRFMDDAKARSVLRDRTYAGALKRYGSITDAVQKRLEYELSIIQSKQFSEYFLIVEDIVKQSPRTCGRGSGAASCVAYCLYITNVDPIRYNLMFERFLNESRTDPPDIDIDFAHDERDSVLDYVFEKYKDHAAMVATHQTMGARAAVREVARVYGMTEDEISAVTRKIPYFYFDIDSEADLQDLIQTSVTTQNRQLDPPWPEIIRQAGRLIGMPRNIGTHCGGVIITSCPITELAPIQTSAGGRPVIQWEKDGAEAMGLVKIDLLGNHSLAVIRDAVAAIKKSGAVFDETAWDPASDRRTQALLANGQSMGVFYVESPAMRQLQQKTNFGDFERLVIHSSIIRPAANTYITEYVKRLRGGSYKDLHPKTRDILAETYGIMVYQEDVARVAMTVAGFTFEDANGLRKIISKKAPERLSRYKEQFFTGAAQNGVDDLIIQNLWDMILSFSGYSFCKPHSASYVQVSMQSAWLKAHYPACFMAAVLANYGGFYTTQAYISESMRLGIVVVSVDVNTSEERYRADTNTVFVGLCQIKGLSLKGRQAIPADRLKNGRFSSMDEFLFRTSIIECDAELLVESGACDSISDNLTRSQLFWQMRCCFHSKNGVSIEKTPILDGFSSIEQLKMQYKALGFLTDIHPVTIIKQQARIKNTIQIDQIKSAINERVQFVGWCVTSKTVGTKDDKSMQFITFEDESAIVETIMFPDKYMQYNNLLQWQEAFLISGMVKQEFGAISVIIDLLKALP